MIKNKPCCRQRVWLVWFAVILAIGGISRASAQTILTAGNAADLVTAINTINSNPGTNYTVSLTGDVSLMAALPSIATSGTLTINGNNHLFSGGSGVSNGLLLTSGNLTINNLTVGTFSGYAISVPNGIVLLNGITGTGAVQIGTGTIPAASIVPTTGVVMLASGSSGASTLTQTVPVDAGVTQAGTGTLTVNTALTYTGPTNIANGTLALAAGGSIAASSGVSLTAPGTLLDISGSGNQTINNLSGAAGSTVTLGNNTLTVNQAIGLGTFNGAIECGNGSIPLHGSCVLSKQGGGTLVLNDPNGSFTGTAVVSGGTLEVGDASHGNALFGGSLDVSNGGALMGHGTISGGVTNAGTVQPGGSIGILTVTGNYVQNTNGILNIEITPNAAAGPGIGYDQLRVLGTASLAGTLNLIDDAGAYTIGSRYTVLTATGGRSGGFTTLSATPLFSGYIDPLVSYDANDVYVTLVPGAALINQAQQVPDALTAMTSAAEGVGDAVLGEVCGLAEQRYVTQGQGCVAHAWASGYRSEVWMHGLGGLGTLTGGGSLLAFHDSFGGVLLGGGISRGGFTLGLGAGYLATGLSFSDGSSASQNAGLGFVYGRYAAGSLRLGAMAAYGGGQVDGSRALPGTGLAATGDRSGEFAIVAGRLTYALPAGPLTLEPRASLAYIHAGQAGFTESGGGLLDLTYANTATDTLEGRLAARATRHFAVGTWVVEPWVEAGVQETLCGLARTAEVSTGAFSGSVSGVSPAPTAALAAVGVDVAASSTLDVFVRYQGLFSANQVENGLSAGLSMRF